MYLITYDKKKSPFCPFVSFLIVLQAPLIYININVNKPDYLADVTTSTISSIFLFEISML